MLSAGAGQHLAAPVTTFAGERTSVKLVVRTAAIEQAESWIREQEGNIDSRPAGASTPTELTTVVASLPLASLAALDRQPWIEIAEAPRRLLPKLDAARGITGLDQALAEIENTELSGAGVLVAVIDSGIDWRHPDFLTPLGGSRLERFVHAHQDDDNLVSRYDVYNTADIDAAIAGSRSGVPQGDPDGHGTHCASIAVGNGAGSPGARFRGVAPGAAIMAVRSDLLLDDQIITGINQAFELAGDRPAVVNLSLGGHQGAHDGTSALENTIAALSGPGRIVVAAAGNEGADGVHWRGDLTGGEDLLIPFRVADSEWQFVDVWFARGDEVDVWVQTPDGALHEPGTRNVHTASGTFRARFIENPLNRDQNLTILLADGRLNDVWQVRVRPTRIVHGEVHAWAGTNDPDTARLLFPGSQESDYSIAIPATEERCIAVGALVSRNSFQTPTGEFTAEGFSVGSLASFSSCGPARHGAMKPDVAAPGQFVTAALAAGSFCDSDPDVRAQHAPEPGYLTMQGTSMAAPFVAGVVALLLQREPTLTPEAIQQRLRITARRDEDTGRVWNNRFGMGKLDARALLAYRERTV